MPRPTMGQVMMNVAVMMTERSTCERAHTGAVICTPEDEIIATGYNGAPRRLAHCTAEGCILINGHCVRANHAEANALMQAAKLGASTKGAWLYCTHRPCVYCAKLIIQAGISRVYYLHEYDTDDAYREVSIMMMGANVAMFKWRGN